MRGLDQTKGIVLFDLIFVSEMDEVNRIKTLDEW